MVVLRRGAASYERGSPVQPSVEMSTDPVNIDAQAIVATVLVTFHANFLGGEIFVVHRAPHFVCAVHAGFEDSANVGAIGLALEPLAW